MPLDVFPGDPFDRGESGTAGNAELSRKHGDGHTCGMKVAHLAHFLWRQFRLVMICATPQALRIQARRVAVAACRPTLPFHIGGVFSRGADKQVVRANTVPYIAMVAHMQTGRNRAACPFIGQAMRRRMTPSDAETAIAVGCTGAEPQPAVARFVHFRPETFLGGDIGASARAKRTVTAGECRPTAETNALSCGTLGRHDLNLLTGSGSAMPGAVSSSAPASCCPLIIPCGRGKRARQTVHARHTIAHRAAQWRAVLEEAG